MKKYKYQDWLKGSVTLYYAFSVYKEDDKPVFVHWDDFSTDDILKIKQKQSEIFDRIVSENVDKFKEQFLARHQLSKMKDELLQTEKQGCFDILFSQIPSNELIYVDSLQISFEYNDLLEIQNFSTRTLLKGIDDGLDYIHSPNNKYQPKNKIPAQVYAHVLFKYYEWLKNDFKANVSTGDKLYKKNIDSLWFKVGLFFAEGKAFDLLDKYRINNITNYTVVAKELGNESYRPYLSDSFNPRSTRDKNIFYNKDKTNFIIDYCNKKNIKIDIRFTEKLNSK